MANIGRMTSAICRDSRFHLSSFSLWHCCKTRMNISSTCRGSWGGMVRVLTDHMCLPAALTPAQQEGSTRQTRSLVRARCTQCQPGPQDMGHMGNQKKTQGAHSNCPLLRNMSYHYISMLLWGLQDFTTKQKAQKENQIYTNLWKNANTALTSPQMPPDFCLH